jgi:hypothetical protein
MAVIFIVKTITLMQKSNSFFFFSIQRHQKVNLLNA